MESIEYKYNEGKLLKEITDYINNTYDEHYSQNKYQATEFIIDGGHGVGFTVGNILKYAQRYGHKGTPTDWRKDLMKVIHYAIMALHVHDSEYPPAATIPADLPPFMLTANQVDWLKSSLDTMNNQLGKDV